MRYKQPAPIWPLMCILSCLFVLSVTAPRSWERIARDEPVEPIEVKQRRPAQSSTTDVGVDRFAKGTPTLADPRATIEPKEAVATSPPPPVEPIGPVEPIEPQPPVANLHLTDAKIEVALRPEVPKPELDVPLPKKTPAPTVDLDPAASIQAARQPESAWFEPEQLLWRLEQLSCSEDAGDWAMKVIGLIHKLTDQGNVSPEETAEALANLRTAGEQVEQLIAQIGEGFEATQLRRLRHALSRRLDLWELAHRFESIGRTQTDRGCPDSAQLALCLNDVETLTESGSEGTAWRRYVLLDALDQLTTDDGFSQSADQRELARRVLKRLNVTRLTADQQEFISDGPLAALTAELRHWAAEPVSLNQLVKRIEEYETTGRASDARRVAVDVRRLIWSPSEETRQMGRRLDMYYRNCNARVAVNERLLNRLLDDPAPIDQATRETILGVLSRGRARTTADLSVHVVPDERRLLMSLDATGAITSDTTSTQSIATLYSRGYADYEVHKLLEIRPDGLRAEPSVAQVDSTVQLRDVRTTLDPVPLVGWFARDRVERQYAELRATAQREIERKVAMRLEQQIDRETEDRIRDVNRRFQDGLLATLKGLSLEPSLMEMRTTGERLIVRARLAGEEQLGAHTPRPRAPSDSLLSIQLHESAINNVLERLELDGQSFTVAKLHERLAERLNHPIPDDLREDVTLTFAAEDALHVRCQDNQVQLTLSLASLRKGDTEWRDFTVRVFYKPDPSVPGGQLVRDGVVRLSSETRLGAKGQIALRGVFSTMFSKERHWRLIPASLAAHPRLQDVEVVQFLIDDGWIGLAIAPHRQEPSEAFAGL